MTTYNNILTLYTINVKTTKHIFYKERTSIMREAKNRDFNGDFLTYKQTAERSNLGLSKVIELAKESGALVKIGKIARVNWNVFYNYIISEYQVRR